MKLTENFLKEDTNVKMWDFSKNQGPILKGKYKNEHAGEVKKYKMSKKELEEYLKKIK